LGGKLSRLRIVFHGRHPCWRRWTFWLCYHRFISNPIW